MKAFFTIPIVCFFLLLASCKNDKSDAAGQQGIVSDSLSETQEPRKVPVPPTPKELAVSTSLMKRLMVEDSLTTLSRLIVTAAMGDQFMGEQGDYTVFAPINQAFEQVEQDTLNSLVLSQNRSRLSALINSHLVHGTIDAAALSARYDKGERSLQTVSGAELRIRKKGRSFQLTDENGNKAVVIRQDIAASNGILFLVDGVLGVSVK